jgi:hypothetical protein
MFYDAQTIARLDRECAQISEKAGHLSAALRGRTYRNELAAEAAIHGACRRLDTIASAIAMVFEALPPALDEIPETADRDRANIALHAFLINEFGFIDNLAGMWAEHKPVRKNDGNSLPNMRIGFDAKCVEVQASVSQAFRDYLATREEWFEVMGAFRHGLAHRIPPYIPHYSVTDRARDDALDTEILQAARAHDFDRVAALQAEQEALRVFQPLVTHSFWANAPVLGVHQQILNDFATIEEFAQRMIAELNAIGIAP